MTKKILRLILIIFGVFLLGGIGGIFFDKYVLPKASVTKLFSDIDFLKKANENVTVINKTEQIIVRDDKPISEIASSPASSVVNLLSTLESKNYLNKNTQTKNAIGVVATSDGVIMTYRDSIIEGEDVVYKVFARDGAEYVARIIGINEYNNLVFLKVDNANLSAVSLANSDDLIAGQKLIAVGSYPYEKQSTFSLGYFKGMNKVLSLAGKTISYSDNLEGVLEMSLSDYNNFVGGPVVNYNGEVVGLMGVHNVDGDVYYFQIPANEIRKSIQQLVSGGFDNRAKLGVYYVTLTRANKNEFNVGSSEGALVYASSRKQGMAVVAGLAGEKAGVKLDDIIISINNEKVEINNPLSKIISKYKKGDIVDMLVKRKGEDVSLKVEF